MATKSPPISASKATTTTDNGKVQTTLYASPLAQHRSLADITGRCSSPQPARYSSRPHSPPTSSPSVDPKAHGSLVNDIGGHRYDYHSTSSRNQEREDEIRREQSPLPRIVSNESTTSNSSAAVGSLESSLSNYSLYTRRALSPRPMLSNRTQSGENSAPTSFDSEHLRSLHQGSTGSNTHQRSNSAEDRQSFKRWGPYTSPVPVHRMQQRPYVPTNLSTREQNSSSGEERHQSPPLHHSKLQSNATFTESSRHRDADKMDVDRNDKQSANTNEQHQNNAGYKRKDREGEGAEQGTVSNSHSHFTSLAPPSSHLYGDIGAARREKIGSANSADEALSKARQLSEGPPEHDELEDDDSDEARQRTTRVIDGKILALAPQRKSCDRCFKMKTKCSRAAPGANGEDPCDGCIRRGYANDCVTSRPDYPYPRISLPKRARRESSLPALLDLNKNAAVYVPPSMQRGNNWRTKLIANSMHREASEGINYGTQHKERLQQSMNEKRSVTPQPLPLRSQEHHHTLQSSSWQLHGHGGSITTQRKVSIPSNAQQSSHNSHLRSLPTSELQDLSLRIAHEVTQRSQAPPLPMTTSLVPSVTVPSQPARSHHQTNQQQGNVTRAMPPNASNLGQQAMQNAPMQLLPKATGIPALQYFDQFIYPLYSLSVLSATKLLLEYEKYTKPGRNNIIELAMAIGLQLQGILLACPDKGQSNTAEGRIFKAFIQTSKSQSDHHFTALHQGDKTDSRVSIDSVKGWLEPSRHRSRAKDIVKHVMMRRCLKSGFDYDDVMETTLLGYYHLVRGEISSFHVCLGNAQRQIALLNIHQSPRDAALWSAHDMMVLRAKATAMDQLHPFSLYTQVSSISLATKDAANMNNDFILMQQKLGEIALFVHTNILQAENSKRLQVGVDDRLLSLRNSLPFLLQTLIRIEWITMDSSKVDGDWISDMIRRESMAPSLQLEIYLKICYMRLVARQPLLKQALDTVKTEGDEEEGNNTLDPNLVDYIRQIGHISTSVMSSIMLAFAVFPHLTCLSQFFAAEVTASAWNYIIVQLVLVQSASKEERQRLQEGFKKMQDKLTPIVEYVSASQEKESWPFAASLEMAKSIIQAIRQEDDDKGAIKWLEAVRHFSTTQPQAFLRLLKGDAYAVEDFRKQATTSNETKSIAPNP